MPRRRIYLANDQVYHVFNRSVEKIPIFTNAREYKRFIQLMDYYRYTDATQSYSNFLSMSQKERDKRLLDLREQSACYGYIHGFCLMNNHFHILMKQAIDNGVHIYLRKVQNAYAKYFNIRRKRVGPLFQGVFKAVRIENDDQLLHISRYIHLNPVSSYIIKPDDLESYIWSSYLDYIGTSYYQFVETSEILGLINGALKYKQFVLDNADYQRTLHILEGKMLH